MLASQVKPTVSVIVVNWNGLRFLGECLTALSRQSYEHCEIIFVDNASSDQSVDFVKENFPHVRIIRLNENTGFTGGNLAGFKVARGDFIALINNDARAEQRWVENLIRPMVEDHSVGICASKLIIDGTDKINSAGDGITTAGVGFNRGLGVGNGAYTVSEPVFGACGAGVVYRRSMLEEVGFLDETFYLYDEDTDLNFRAQLAGWKCLYVADAIVYHKVNATAGRLSYVQVYYHTRNLELVWIKNMPTGLMLRYAHHKLIQELGAFFYLCIRHWKWVPFLRAKRDAIQLMPEMWRKRKELQRRRRVSNKAIRQVLTPIFSLELLRQKANQLIRG